MTPQVPAGSPFLSDARLQSLLDDAQPVPPPPPAGGQATPVAADIRWLRG
jgi:hypothetical protein